MFLLYYFFFFFFTSFYLPIIALTNRLAIGSPWLCTLSTDQGDDLVRCHMKDHLNLEALAACTISCKVILLSIFWRLARGSRALIRGLVPCFDRSCISVAVAKS